MSQEARRNISGEETWIGGLSCNDDFSIDCLILISNAIECFQVIYIGAIASSWD